MRVGFLLLLLELTFIHKIVGIGISYLDITK